MRMIVARVMPLLVGLLHGWTGCFDAAAVLFVALGLGIALSGLGAGRAVQLRVRGEVRTDGSRGAA